MTLNDIFYQKFFFFVFESNCVSKLKNIDILVEIVSNEGNEKKEKDTKKKEVSVRRRRKKKSKQKIK